MTKVFKYIITFYIFGIMFSCNEEEFISAQEPDIPTSNKNPEIEEIVVDYIWVDNNSVSFSWNIQQTVVRYDIIINDTITQKDIDLSGYVNGLFHTVQGLDSDKEHKITIRAFDKNENIKTHSFVIRTKKDLIVDVKQIILNKHRYNYLGYVNCFITKNKDFIISASAEVNGKPTIIIFKLTKEYKIVWLTETPLNSISSISEFSDGSLLLVHSSGATKLSVDGNILWNKEMSMLDLSIYAGIAIDDNTSYLAGSLFEYGPTHQLYIVKLDNNGSILWEHYGDKKTYENMYWPSKIFVNNNNNIVVTGGTWNDGAAYGGEENLFFFEYNQQGKLLSEKKYTINDIPHFFSSVNYIEKKDDGSYIIFTPVQNWETTRLSIETLNINLDNNLNLVDYKIVRHVGGQAVSTASVYKREDGLYSLLSNERGNGPLTFLIFTRVNSRSEAKITFGFQEYQTGIMAFGEDEDKTTYITTNGLIITLNNEGVVNGTYGVPRLIPDEIIEYKK